VFSAEDETLARRVAIKLIRPEFVSETTFRLRFEREAKAIARVVHPGVVTLYDSGSTEDGQLYLIMEHLKGLPVSLMLHRYGRANPVQVAQFLRQGARALKAAHEAGVVHRDLKPGNIFLVPQPEQGFQLKILDFGLAQSESFGATLTRTGAVIGTPQYMASEQLLGGQTGPRTDLYAFAAVAYEILTRKPLVAESEVAALLRGTLRVEPWPASRYVPALPPEVDASFATALAWEAEDRPADLLTWADGLALILDSVEVPGGWPEVVPVGGEESAAFGEEPRRAVPKALPPTIDQGEPRDEATREL
jgi:serine/threonine protein kinase